MAAIDNTHHIEEQLSAYIDGELKPAEREEVEEHLRICKHCRAEYEELKKVAELVSVSLRSVRCISDTDRAAYVNGLLGESEKQKVEDHLARCHRCREEMAELQRWLREDPPEAAPAAKPHARPARKPVYRYISIYAPLAAAAALLIASISLMLPKGDLQPPAIAGLTVRTAIVRSQNNHADVKVRFGDASVLRTNDMIGLTLQPGGYKHAVLFCVLPSGEVFRTERHDSLSGEVRLPENGLWTLGTEIGTEAILIAFSEQPLTDEDIACAKRVLAEAGEMPALPYGCVLWLDTNGRWQCRGAVPNSAAELNAWTDALRKALAQRAPVFQGIAYDHQ